jgi:hypothetical protein
MALLSSPAAATETAPSDDRKLPFYRVLWVQVLFSITLAIILGYVDPARAVAMKPLGDAFIRAISMIVTLIIFCTVVTGIAGMENLKKVGRVGGMALLYFEVVSTIALLIGLVIGNAVRPGGGFNVDVSTLDAKAVADYAGQAKAQSVTEFLMHIIPTTVVDAFAKGDILEVVFVALLFGFALSAAGPRSKPLIEIINSLTHVVFRVVNILMKVAPIGAFGAMAYTVGKFGLASLGPLAKLIATFCGCSARAYRVVGEFQHFSLPRLHQGRNFTGSCCKFVRDCDSDTNVEAGKTRVLQIPCWTGGSDRVHFQHRRNQSLHDHGSALCSTGNQHSFDADAAVHHPCRRGSDFQGSKWRARRFLHCSGVHTIGDPDNSGGRHGADPGN